MTRQIPENIRSSGPFEIQDNPHWSDLQPLSGKEAPSWDGFDPPNRLAIPVGSTSHPVQKTNLKPAGVYDGIEAIGDEWMRLACDLARASVEQKGGPFGAVILQIDDASRRVLRYWTGSNQVVLAHDPTAHAEVTAIRAACASLGIFDLDSISKEESLLSQPGQRSHCVVYSSAEPCPMCYAALRWAKVRRLCFAATRFDAAAPGVEFSDLALYEELAVPYGQRGFEVFQCATGNSLDAFNLWKRSDKTAY